MIDRQGDLESLAVTLRTRLNRTSTLRQELADSIDAWMATEPFRLDATIADDSLSWAARVECVNPPPVALSARQSRVGPGNA